MGTEFKLQDPGEGVHEVEVQEVLVSVGDKVEEGQSILVVESDKAAIEVPASMSGTIADIKVKEGDVVEVGSTLVVFEEGGGETGTEEARDKAEGAGEEAETADTGEEDAKREPSEEDTDSRSASEGPDEEEDAEETEDRYSSDDGEKDRSGGGLSARKQPSRDKDGRPVPASPAARRLASELGVDLAAVTPSGKHGNVTKEDIRAQAEKGKSARKGDGKLPEFSRWGEVERQPLRSVRRATARQMARSWEQIPHVTHSDVIDITDLEGRRRALAEKLEGTGARLTMTVILLKAAVSALKAFPRFNASLDTDAEEIVLKHYYHLGVALDSERGLLVPVLRDVDKKTLGQLAGDLTDLADRVRGGKAEREDLSGGSFTITNVGALGGTTFTPIINYPQVAILGVGRARLQPVIKGDLNDYKTVARLMMPVSLGFDHRVNDGADAARFVNHLKEILEDPDALMLAL
jgi:pyruvate dehydrogenase E2 component (dihydrolipoamide acetyltransferase)